jgi:hypothetical protein
MSTTQLLQTAIKTQSALSSIGTSPYSSDGKSVKGEDTDGLVNHVKNYWLYMIAVGGVASAGASNRGEEEFQTGGNTMGRGMIACFGISQCSFCVFTVFAFFFIQQRKSRLHGPDHELSS